MAFQGPSWKLIVRKDAYNDVDWTVTPGSSGLSKSAKKNKKKREKKQRDALARQSAVSKEQLAPDPSELLEMMKKELEIAKAKQVGSTEHKSTAKLSLTT